MLPTCATLMRNALMMVIFAIKHLPKFLTTTDGKEVRGWSRKVIEPAVMEAGGSSISK